MKRLAPALLLAFLPGTTVSAQERDFHLVFVGQPGDPAVTHPDVALTAGPLEGVCGYEIRCFEENELALAARSDDR